MTGGGSGSGRRHPPRNAGDDRRQRRLAQLTQMADDEFAAEVREHQNARWSSARLITHARDHRRHFEKILGRRLSPDELQNLSRAILTAWDRLFTDLEPDRSATYVFVRTIAELDHAMIVIVRGGRIRTTFPTESLVRWLARQPIVVEVTERARRLGL